MTPKDEKNDQMDIPTEAEVAEAERTLLRAGFGRMLRFILSFISGGNK